MPKINILPKEIFQLIAAGEVVERPSSVIKEMIENSIDAGAKSVTVEIKNGGITYMRITDNGTGIDKEDIKNVFVSHATSKLAVRNDLEAIATLGFRGEAMASIASVAKVELLTKTASSPNGFRYVIHGGEERAFDEAGCAGGTTVVVRDLFFNTPARMKFLKKDATEGNSVAGVVERIALSHPDVSFRFIRDGKQSFSTTGDGKLLNTIYGVCGGDFAKGLLKAETQLNGLTVSGYISKPIECRANRKMQYFFVNGRLVQSKTCFAALDQSYKNSVMVGKFPACVLNVSLDPALTDVNVHPAKIEVRFANEKNVFDAIYYACKGALGADTSRKEASFPVQKKAEPSSFFKKEDVPVQFNITDSSTAKIEPNPNFWGDGNVQKTYQRNAPISSGNASSPVQKYVDNSDIDGKASKVVFEKTKNIVANMLEDIKESFVKEETRPSENGTQHKLNEETEFKLVGQAFKTYIIIEIENELFFVDKHAAHERIIFEKLRNASEVSMQMLLSPEAIKLPREEYDAVLSGKELLLKAGYEVDDFGESTLIVRACPTELDLGDVKSTIVEIAGLLIDGKTDITTKKMDWIYHSTACRAAVKAGDATSEFEMKIFVKQLLKMPNIRYCPHGRPIMIKMSKYEIEKQFGRA